MVSLYLHIPFCLRRCNYCDFLSSVATCESVVEYADALVRNLHSYERHSLSVDTIYFGGGTPSLLPVASMQKIMTAIRESFNVISDAEITVEANPGTVNSKILDGFSNCGINRLSIGIQSCKDNELAILGRLHNFSEAVKAVEMAKSCGLKNISCDLMMGIPNQTIWSLQDSVTAIADLDVQHVSAYMLKIEEGTPFDCNEIRALCPDDDTVADMYIEAIKDLSKRGFIQYEISNFAKPGFESKHNLKYWTGGQYIGFGASAHSFYEGRRFFVPPDIKKFVSSPLQSIEIEDASPDTLEEYIMLSLRLCKGASLSKIRELNGNIESVIEHCKPLENAGLLTVSENISLTPEGFLVSNGIIADLIEAAKI